jgi:hypothetical protein
MMTRYWPWVGLAAASLACATHSQPRDEAPVEGTRLVTGGTELYKSLPAHADAVLEVDVARLRDNPTLGPVVMAVSEAAAGRLEAEQLGLDPLREIDLFLAAVYRLGTDDSEILFVLRGRRIHAAGAASRIPQAEALDERTLLVGPPGLRGRVARLGTRESMAGDQVFLRLRDAAMPRRAQGASIRLTARLNHDARIAAAGRLAVDEMPATISVWMDVADDVALVALLGADDGAQAKRFSRAVTDASARLAKWIPEDLGGRSALRGVRTELAGTVARVVWLVGPRAFDAWATELRMMIEQGRYRQTTRSPHHD